jgi:GPI mannosyltransferase 3
MMHVVASKSIVDLTPKAVDDRDGKKTSGSWLNFGWMLFFLLNMLAIIMAVRVYSDGPIEAMDYFRRLRSEELRNGSVGFLMPCHSTPWQSYLHRKELEDPGRLWAIGCEPPLGCVACVYVYVCGGANSGVIGI